MPSIYFFVFLYIMSFLMVMSSEDWFLVWLSLEINMMSFLIIIYRRYDMWGVESCMKYFFIQGVGSALFIGMIYGNMMSGFILLILSYKIGAGPFFFWFPSLCSSLNWSSCFTLMIFQKIIPLMLMTMFIQGIIWVIAVMSLLSGVMGSFNQSSIKQLMAYSSIHHLGWILMLMVKMDFSWFLYLIIYSIILGAVIISLMEEEIDNMSALYFNNKSILFMFMLMNMGGMPPMLGFFLKWMALMSISWFGLVIMMLLIISSVIMLYIYIRITYDVMMGGGIEICNYGMLSYYKIVMDTLIMLGMMMGMILGIFIMF